MKHKIATYNTKKLLSDSLKKIMHKKSFSKITVSEITDDCNLNRKTFYYHFKDSRDLLKWTLEQEAIDIIKEYSQMKNYGEAIEFIADYVEKNRYLFAFSDNSVSRDELVTFFKSDIIEIIRTGILQKEDEMNMKISDTFREFLCDFYCESLVGQIAALFENGNKYNKKQLVEYVTLIFSCSIPNIIEASVKRQV